VGGVAAGGTDGVHDVDIRAAHAPHIHHSHGQILLVHLQVYSILHHTLNILQGAGEHHAGVRLQDGQVDEMIGLQQAAGQLDMMEVGAVAADSHIDQVLVGLNIVELHALLAGHIGYARDLIAFHGIAADGGSLGNNNALGIGFLDFADDCADDLGIGADRSIGGGSVAGVGLEHYSGAGLDHVCYAAHQVKDLGDAVLNTGLFGQSNQRFLVRHTQFSLQFLVISISINGLCKADAKCNEPLFAKLQGDLGRVVAEIGQYTIACCSAETNLE
jgi:hypothetical protein